MKQKSAKLNSGWTKPRDREPARAASLSIFQSPTGQVQHFYPKKRCQHRGRARKSHPSVGSEIENARAAKQQSALRSRTRSAQIITGVWLMYYTYAIAADLALGAKAWV